MPGFKQQGGLKKTVYLLSSWGTGRVLIMELSLYPLFSWTIPFVSFTTEYRAVLNASRFLDNDTNSNMFY